MQKISFWGIPLEVYKGKGHDKAWFDVTPFSSEGFKVEGYGAFRKHSVYFHLEVSGTTYMGEIKYCDTFPLNECENTLERVYTILETIVSRNRAEERGEYYDEI